MMDHQTEVFRDVLENIAIALARRRIKSSGNVKKALALVPVTKPVFAKYREMIEREYPHLAE